MTTILLAVIVSGAAQAAAYGASGTSTVTRLANQSWSASFTATAGNVAKCENGLPHWVNGDTFTFSDHVKADNTAGTTAMTAEFLLELYEWVNGAAGPLLDSDTVEYTVQAGQISQGDLSVSGTYTAWNGANVCQLSMHVYRHAGSPDPTVARSDYY